MEDSNVSENLKPPINTKNRLIKKKKNQKIKVKNMHKIKDFTILKDVAKKKEIKIVGRVLPLWLSNPILINQDLNNDKRPPQEVCPSLHKSLLKKLNENNVIHLFPIQKAVLLHLLQEFHGMESRFRPRDLCVATPTGSGKTLAFVLPVIQSLHQKIIPALRVLVILPVIELAKQVFDVFQTYASAFHLKIGKAFGLENLSSEQAELIERVNGAYCSKVDILVSTPGRLTEHILKTPGLDFSQLRFLVLDEVDKLLAGDGGVFVGRLQRYLMQFKQDHHLNVGRIPPYFSMETVEEPDFFASSIHGSKNELQNEASTSGLFHRSFQRNILHVEEMNEMKREHYSVPCVPYQRLMFSATLTKDPEQLRNVALFRPILFMNDSGKAKINMIGDVTRPKELTEEYIKTDEVLKPLILHYILSKERKKYENFKAIVFASSIELASKLYIIIKALSKDKYSVTEFSAKFKKHRKNKLSEFSKKKTNVLISTDAMARGIDVQGVNCVISYEVPSANTYIHRIGRTARAGNPGKAVSLVTESEFKDFKKMMKEEFKGASQRFIKESKLRKYEMLFQEALNILAKVSKLKKNRGNNMKTLKRKKWHGKNFK